MGIGSVHQLPLDDVSTGKQGWEEDADIERNARLYS
jgi:hypothetical protein